VLSPQTNVLWRGVEEGMTEVLVYTLSRGVGVGCLWVFVEWFVCMMRVVIF